MKHITCYVDFISPYAYLAFEQMPEALTGISYSVEYRPVLFAAITKHHGQLGPAEIAPKRDWTYRQVMWLANSLGIALQLPASHPFNPLPLLRLSIACDGLGGGQVSRYTCETVFRHIWQGGADASDGARFQRLVEQLGPVHDLQSELVKSSLKKNTDQAIASGVFGVPSFCVDDKVFWGLDALPMLRDYLLDEPWFANGGWQRAEQISVGIQRKG